MSAYRVYVSAVTNEFGRAREFIASRLRSKGLDVKVQGDFRQEGVPTLQKIHDYIAKCDAVVCIVGRRSGAIPPSGSVRGSAWRLPDGLEALSYTQWEIVFARRLAKKCLVYIAANQLRPDDATTGFDDPTLQERFVDWLLHREGVDRDTFESRHQLTALVMEQDWPRGLKRKLNTLPSGPLGSLFKGRESFLRETAGKLLSRYQPVTDGDALRTQVICGLGGIGKTRAAIEFAHRYAASFSTVLFLHAGSPGALRRNIAELVGTDWLDLDAQTVPDETRRVDSVMAWLEDNPGWLLILDSVDSEAAAAEVQLLLARLTRGHVVVTSRIRNWPATVGAIDLDVLDESSSLGFLLERTEGRRRPGKRDSVATSQLVAELGGLALALEQAASHTRDVAAARQPVPRYQLCGAIYKPSGVGALWA